MSEVIEKEPSCLLVLSIRGEHMKNVTDSFVFSAHWPFAGNLGFNTEILARIPFFPCCLFKQLVAHFIELLYIIFFRGLSSPCQNFLRKIRVNSLQNRNSWNEGS